MTKARQKALIDFIEKIKKCDKIILYRICAGAIYDIQYARVNGITSGRKPYFDSFKFTYDIKLPNWGKVYFMKAPKSKHPYWMHIDSYKTMRSDGFVYTEQELQEIKDKIREQQ